jgi:hypothetical protein
VRRAVARPVNSFVRSDTRAHGLGLSHAFNMKGDVEVRVPQVLFVAGSPPDCLTSTRIFVGSTDAAYEIGLRLLDIQHERILAGPVMRRALTNSENCYGGGVAGAGFCMGTRVWLPHAATWNGYCVEGMEGRGLIAQAHTCAARRVVMGGAWRMET